MILRTFRFTNIFEMPLAILALGLSLCLITSEAKVSLTPNSEASRSVFEREANLDGQEQVHKSLNTSRPNVGREIAKIGAKPTPNVPPNLNIDSQSQEVHNTLNATVDKIETEDFDKSIYKLNTAALLRGFYVFGGLGAMVVMYILVRTIRLRRKKTTVRRYGILTNREDVEMTPLGADDDEDTTIFDMNNVSRS